MRNVVFVIVFFFFISCKIKKPDTSTINGVYVRYNNKNDVLKLNEDGKYFRIIDRDTIINGNNWYLSTDDVFFTDWINKNDFPIKLVKKSSPILNCRYDNKGYCYKIEINSDGDYYLKNSKQ